MDFTTDSPDKTIFLARALASLAKNGDVFALNGTLGAGKTTFTQGFCSYFNVSEYVTSPTFTLINEYHGSMNIYHIDLYRLENLDESYDIGIEEYLPPASGVTLLEWADKFPEVLPDSYVSITIRYGKGNTRELSVTGTGPAYSRFNEQLSSIRL